MRTALEQASQPSTIRSTIRLMSTLPKSQYNPSSTALDQGPSEHHWIACLMETRGFLRQYEQTVDWSHTSGRAATL